MFLGKMLIETEQTFRITNLLYVYKIDYGEWIIWLTHFQMCLKLSKIEFSNIY